MSEFFAENYQAIRDFSDSLEKFSPSSEEEREVARLLRAAVKAVTFNHEEYDALATYTPDRQGKAFLQIIQQPLDLAVMRRALLFLAGFIREVTLVRESRSDSEQFVLDYFLGTSSSPSEDDWGGYHQDFLRYVLPNKLFESNYRAIEKSRTDTKKLIEDTSSQASALEQRIAGYKAELKKLESEYNFVGLSHAFKGLLDRKLTDSRLGFAVVVLLGLAAIAVPFYATYSNAFAQAMGSGWSPSAVAKLSALAGIEIVILYFFRVALSAYLLARSQVTNLQLRVALCTFIEGYLEFAAKAQAAKATTAIAGFESLIFGGLPAGDSALPATIDGLEQITKLISAARSK